MISEQDYLDKDVVNLEKKAEQRLAYSVEIEKKLSHLAKEGFPYEVCGFLLGKSTVDVEVCEIVEVKNIATDRLRRFEIDPLDYIKVEELAFQKGLELIGIYHSHPNYPAIPSKSDLEFAQVKFSYVIVSVERKDLVLINSWKKQDNKFINQKIKIN